MEHVQWKQQKCNYTSDYNNHPVFTMCCHSLHGMIRCLQDTSNNLDISDNHFSY